MDFFETYEKYVHEDVKPADTPKDEDLFELEGDKSRVDIPESNTEKDQTIEDLTKKVAELTETVNKLSTPDIPEEGE